MGATPTIQRLARTARRGLYGTPLLAPLASRVRPRACVLAYHRVARATVDPAGQAVSPERFAQHLRVLAESYRVVDVERLLADLASGSLRDGTVAVTFDDGYADTLTEAAPIAEECATPLHVFVTMRPVLEGGLFWWDELALRVDAGSWPQLHAELKRLPAPRRSERLLQLGEVAPDEARRHSVGRPLTLSELQRLAALPHVTVGAHSLTHTRLADLSPADQRLELQEARSELERAVGGPVATMSYPFGKDADLSPQTPQLAAEAGYEAAFTTTARPLTRRSPRFELPRLTAHDWAPAELRRRLRSFFGY